MKKWLRITLILVFSATFLLSGGMLLSYYLNAQKQQSQFDQLALMVQNVTVPHNTTPDITRGESPPQQDATEPAEPQILPEYQAIYELNAHTIGWMCIDGTRINYPVMQTPDAVDYYLHKDFYGNYSSHGCLYAREQCDVFTPSDNITIYGHNMKDGSMFADLLDYRYKSFWDSHRYISFNTLYERHTYEIFAVLLTNARRDQGFPYHRFVDAETPEDFDEFITDCKNLSLYDTGITPVYGDKLITLSTCEYSQKVGRLVVVAKQID